MSSLRTVCAALCGIACLLAVVVQFTPWASYETSAFGSSAKVTYNTWNAESEGSFGGFEGSDSHGWYSEDADDAAGADQIRIAIPLLLAGLVVALAGALVSGMRGGGAGPILCLVAGLCLAAGTVLFAMGVDATFDDGGISNYDWNAAFYMAIAASALSLVGGIVGLVGGNRQAGGA